MSQMQVSSISYEYKAMQLSPRLQQAGVLFLVHTMWNMHAVKNGETRG